MFSEDVERPTVIAGSLQVPAVGLYGTSYIPAYSAIQPVNPNARYLQAEGSLDRLSPGSVLEAVRELSTRTPSRDRESGR